MSKTSSMPASHQQESATGNTSVPGLRKLELTSCSAAVLRMATSPSQPASTPDAPHVWLYTVSNSHAALPLPAYPLNNRSGPFPGPVPRQPTLLICCPCGQAAAPAPAHAPGPAMACACVCIMACASDAPSPHIPTCSSSTSGPSARSSSDPVSSRLDTHTCTAGGRVCRRAVSGCLHWLRFPARACACAIQHGSSACKRVSVDNCLLPCSSAVGRGH